MNSSLFECRLLHHRFHPRTHRFNNRVFFFALDLAELDSTGRRLRLFSHNRRNLYALWNRDFFPAPNTNDSGGNQAEHLTLLEKVRLYLNQQKVATGPDLRVLLVTIPRIAGYLFNPVSFYFCHDGDQPLCAVAEVTNTFREVKKFILKPGAAGTAGAGRFSGRMPKEFYVSPFADSGGEFSFSMRCSDGQLNVTIDEYEEGRLMLHSVVSGQGRPLNDRTLAWFALKYPMLGLQVMTRIHTQAFRLYLKRFPWWRKTDQLSRQKNYYQPTGKTFEP